MAEPIAYKVLTAGQLIELEHHASFAGAPVDLADGYIHMSTAAQLDETLAKHFAGQKELTVAAVDLAALGDAVRWEPSRGGQLFPHLYGALTLDSLIAYGPLEREEDGSVRLPTAG
jgi:uncharacterized protein (DUF952 family)